MLATMLTSTSKSVQPSTSAATERRSFRARMHEAREDAIITAVNRLLAEKGFDAMTVDEVAAEVGIAKASLYKHFPSKEDLAATAMARVMQRAVAFLNTVNTQQPALERLRATARWTMQLQLAGQMPSLPSENSSLRTALAANVDYMDGLLHVSETLGSWIEAAQADGGLDQGMPAIAVLYTLYARACDPVLGFLKGSGQYSDDEIIDMVLRTCFEGLRSR
jgi:AcrR family transcriptional regulator